MNNLCKKFVEYVLSSAPKHSKRIVEEDVRTRFSLIQDRKVFHNESFAVRFSYSKSNSPSFSNTILSLSALEKYDKIPFFVVLIRQSSDNLILLANTTFLKKISHSSQELSMTNIKGSFNGSDIMRELDGVQNSPENFEYLFAIHQGLDWNDNLSRLVDATSQIKSVSQKFQPTDRESANIFSSIERSARFISSESFAALKADLDERCEKCKREIAIASHIENVNIRGRLIESLITADDIERERIMRNLACIESALPIYDTRNGLGDYCRQFGDTGTLTDIKTKVVYLNSNPKAYNVDKFLRQMSDGRSIFLIYIVGVDEHGIFRTLLSSVYHDKLIDGTILQFHWAGRSSRGVAQFRGAVLDCLLKDMAFHNVIDKRKCIDFINGLLHR